VMAEAMRRAYADRARYLGDSDFVTDMPIARLIAKPYAVDLRKTIHSDKASTSTPTSFEWPTESHETTQISVVDAARNAVSMTYTLEQGFGVKIVVPGAGFLLNNEMGDFNAGPDLTNDSGLIGTTPNLAAPAKRMLSSMSPTILAKSGKLFMVTGSPGGRTIINTVLETIVNVIDFGMSAQDAVDAGRFHHQWLPDRIAYERFSLSPDTLALLRAKGHDLVQVGSQGVAEVIVHNAATGVIRPALETEDKHWDWTMNANARSLLALARATVPAMDAGSAIVAISSLGSRLVLDHYVLVGTSKAALESVMRYLAVELAPRGIRVNAVSAGVVDTDALEWFPNKEEMLATVDRTPAGRLVEPADVAAAVSFLSSGDAAMVCGQTLIVDGGFSLKA